jgi:amino-acid N-acetyltransferase
MTAMSILAHDASRLTTLPETPAVTALRAATAADAPALHALIERHLREGHLLPRTRAELECHAARFLVAEQHGRIVACAELAPLSQTVAEIRSLVVDGGTRGLGLGRLLVDQLARRARVEGFVKLCAFAHEPAYFVRLGFSIVPHTWLPEKIATDCAGCALFRQCGQQAMLLMLDEIRPRVARAGAKAAAIEDAAGLLEMSA